MTPANATPASSFAPLRHASFAVLWVATVLGNVGSFMRDVASSWLVTDLSASPTAVALIQTAATLPVFLLGVPSGAMADIVDETSQDLRFNQRVLEAALENMSQGISVVDADLRLVAWRAELHEQVLAVRPDALAGHAREVDGGVARNANAGGCDLAALHPLQTF